MSKKVYTEEDIYEGMVLECVYKESDWWVIGKQYIVDKNLCIYDEVHDKRDITSILNRLNDPNEYLVKFKVVESEEKQELLQLFNYHFGLKTGDVETVTYGLGDDIFSNYHTADTKKHITIPAYNTQQAIEYLTNELEYDINDIVSMEVKFDEKVYYFS